MAIDGAQNPFSPRQLASFLRAERERILEVWSSRVLEDPTVPEANRLSKPLLRDHIPQLLDRLVDSLQRRAGNDGAGEIVGRELGHASEARAHAQLRFLEGYSLPAALRELSHFRATVMELCAERGGVPAGEGALMVHSAMDEAMSTAAVEMERASHDELEASERRYRQLAEASPQIVWTAQPDGRADYYNQQWFGYTGQPPERVEPYAWKDMVHPEDLPRTAAAWEAALASAEPFSIEYRLRRADGQYRWHVARAVPLRDDAGRVLKWLWVCVDVEDQKQAEATLRREGEFRERFVGMLGHDLRQPLASITFTSAALLRQEGASEGQLRAIRRIAAAGERMARMIDDLLDFTRSRQGGIPIARTDVDLHAVARRVIDEIETARPERTLRGQFRGAAHGHWDADRIAQLISNLVTNALNYSPPDSPVDVRVTGEDGAVELLVHNEGPPIPDEVRATIFDPFRRPARTPGQSVSTGLGLGLYIVHEVVRAHGGTIEFTSDTPTGTTFTVRLPRETGTGGVPSPP